MLGRALLIGSAIYLIAGVIALMLVPASAYGWFGMERDSLSAVFALILAMPWSLLATFVDDPAPMTGFLIMALGIAINAVALLYLASRITARG